MPTITRLNMHADLVISGSQTGPVTLTAKDSAGATHAVVISHDLAQQIHAVPNGTGSQGGGHRAPANMHADAVGAVTPYNMHADGTVQTNTKTLIVIVGPATHGSQNVQLELTIDGPARKQLNGTGI